MPVQDAIVGTNNCITASQYYTEAVMLIDQFFGVQQRKQYSVNGLSKLGKTTTNALCKFEINNNFLNYTNFNFLYLVLYHKIP